MIDERMLAIGPDHPSLAGHFPGHPVVPGVVLLMEVFESLRRLIQQPARIIALPSVKFSSPLKPGESLVIRIELEQPGHAAFSCHVGTRLVASGSMEFEPRLPNEMGAA